MVNDRAFVPKSRSSAYVKVKYQGHSFRKNGLCMGIGVSRKHHNLFGKVSVKL